MVFLLIFGIAGPETFLCVLHARIAPQALKRICLGMLCLFLLPVLYVTVFSRDQSALTGVKLVPFWSYALAVNGLKAGIVYHLWQIVLNVFLFMPFGVVIPFCVPKPLNAARFWLLVLFAVAFSLMIECIQYFCRLGVFDIDDLIDNGIGFAAGMGLSVFCGKRLENHPCRW